MGVQATITLYAPDESVARGAAAAAFARIARLEDAITDYDDDSEAMRLTGAASPRRVSDDLYRALSISRELSARTDGAFDPTVGALTRLWREARRRSKRPDDAACANALDSVGWKKIALDPKEQTAWLRSREARLDFGGIGKGLAADVAAEVLEAQGIESYLVDVGGDLRLGAAPPGRNGWRVRLGSDHGTIVELSRCGVATSGGAEQFLEIDGTRYSHILDPRNGRPVTGHYRVTVIAPTGGEADALASALSVVGGDGVARWTGVAGVAAEVVLGSNRVVRSDNFPYEP